MTNQITDTYYLNPVEITQIGVLVNSLRERFESVESDAFSIEATKAAKDLPIKLKELLDKYRFGGGEYTLIKNYPIEASKLGPSPSHWDQPWTGISYLDYEIYQCLISSYIGNIFGWRTQENGRFLRHITPIKKDAFEQLGGSSQVTLVWHTEEAFHPARADCFTLKCYRNHEQAQTLFVPVSKVVNCLDEATIKLLMQPLFIIEPDKSHFPDQNTSDYWRMYPDQFEFIKNFLENPKPTPLIFKKEQDWFFCIDQAFTKAINNSIDAGNALEKLWSVCDEVGDRIMMEPGDLAVINNRTVAHGRSIYNPLYGDQQRWLRRVNVSTSWENHSVFHDQTRERVIA